MVQAWCGRNTGPGARLTGRPEVCPGFLKKNTRLEALRFVYFIAQLVAALIERTLRQNMLRLGIKAIPIRPKTFIDPFTEIQKTGLKLLEIGPAVYR